MLVEDDAEQATISREVLVEEGFEVRAFEALAPVLEYLQHPPELIDLFVLDRRLPVRLGDNASDELGDELLAQVSRDNPDACIIVFTGFASIEHVQRAVHGSGPLPDHEGEIVDRISVLQKHQSLEFRSRVRQLRGLLQSLEDIELVIDGGAETSTLHRRMLRRLALHYGAASVTAHPLGGGLTDAAVWRCELRGPLGPISTVVAKQGKRGKVAEVWLTELIPKAFVATGIATITGLMGGTPLHVFQIAGDDPVPLMELLRTDPARAVEVVRPVWQALNAVSSQRTVQRIDEICAPLVAWDMLAVVLEAYQIPVPAGSLTASTAIGVRHGDLHPGNVLSVDGQAVLIDFDSCAHAAGGLDPVTMLVSTLVHPDSPIRGGGWPDAAHIEAAFDTPDFGVGHPCEAWFRGVHDWMSECCASDRERWALVLAYSSRQLQYGDVLESPDVVERVVALATWAASKLGE
ncbi:MAG: response regulator [Actinomycetota bacterium]|nr:response regulator [Actinomycetota bacterium]